MIRSIFRENKMSLSPQTYPAITLRENVVFPYTTAPLILEGKESIETINQALSENRQFVLNFAKPDGISSIGVLVQVLQFWHLTPEVMGTTLEILRRVRILKIYKENEIVKADVLELTSSKAAMDTETLALARSVFHQYNEFLTIEGTLSSFAASQLQDETLPPNRISDAVASALRLPFEDKLLLLETLDVKRRLIILNEKLAKELSIAKTEKTIQKDVTDEVNKSQREFILRERMKAIEKELGITTEQENYTGLETKIKAAGMPKDTENKVLKELSRLRHMPAFSPEAPYISTYLEVMANLPWSKKTDSEINLSKARQTLDADHYGLEKVKERILEYLAVQKLTKGQAKGNILCFVGPPGVGKTSVGQSIAKALGRKFVRISLGGIHDESEIRGHRRTYVGAMPGRIIESIRDVETKNPVFMMDEIDKVGSDFRGDPASALLEVLDPAQNSSFSDHYIDTPFDLSQIFFITTANIVDPIPPALRDRMEIIEFSGYTNEEKLQIAKRFLLPKIILATGLKENCFMINDDAIIKIITHYSREAGVRELERKISQIARKVARQIVENNDHKQTKIAKNNLADYLGPEQFPETVLDLDDEVGVATGLAWTPVGGETINIETSIVPGRRNLTLTGQLGDIMKESAQAALTFIRSQSKKLNFDPEFYLRSDIHIHVPEGSVPKDGSSAGVAMAIALASAVTNRLVKKNVAMTGEITLRGKVLPVAGVKEKIVAAYRAGVKTVILPQINKKDLVDVPEEVKKNLEFAFINNADEAFEIALRK